MSDNPIIERLVECGIDRDRLGRVLESGDNFGHLVYAFEVLTVLGAVYESMPEPSR